MIKVSEFIEAHDTRERKHQLPDFPYIGAVTDTIEFQESYDQVYEVRIKIGARLRVPPNCPLERVKHEVGREIHEFMYGKIRAKLHELSHAVHYHNQEGSERLLTELNKLLEFK